MGGGGGGQFGSGREGFCKFCTMLWCSGGGRGGGDPLVLSRLESSSAKMKKILGNALYQLILSLFP